MAPRKTDKRARLISAATLLIHQQGFYRTTLADIAETGGVPLGNVYYYFKTKDEIGEAVVEYLASVLHDRLQLAENNPDHKVRLILFLQHEMSIAETTARFGCPVGGLCNELAKQGGVLADDAAKLLNDTMEWSEKQFRGLGCGEHARELAIQFLARIQGAALLTNAFHDPKLMAKLGQSLLDWLEVIAGSNKTKSGAVGQASALA